MKNIPQKIYLQLGDDIRPDEDDLDFRTLTQREISWCADRIFKSDLEYVLVIPDKEGNMSQLIH